MKKCTILLYAVIATSFVFAQDSRIEITPSAGYTFSSSTDWGYASINVEDNYSMGLAADIRVREDVLIELMFNRLSTNATAQEYNGYLGNTNYETPVDIEYYHIGGVREFSSEKVRPFTMLTLGGTRMHATGKTEVSQDLSNLKTTQDFSDVWTFSATIGGGAKIMFSDRIGLRLQARLLMPFYFDGIGVYCGGGCGGGASFGVYFLQMDFTGGLVIALGE